MKLLSTISSVKTAERLEKMTRIREEAEAAVATAKSAYQAAYEAMHEAGPEGADRLLKAKRELTEAEDKLLIASSLAQGASNAHEAALKDERDAANRKAIQAALKAHEERQTAIAALAAPLAELKRRMAIVDVANDKAMAAAKPCLSRFDRDTQKKLTPLIRQDGWLRRLKLRVVAELEPQGSIGITSQVLEKIRTNETDEADFVERSLRSLL